MPASLTILDDDREATVTGEVAEGRVLVAATDLAGATGWELKPEGLCREEMCVPLLGREVKGDGGLIDLAAAAGGLGRPFAAELDGEPVVALGPRAEEVPGVVRIGDPGPDFTVDTVDGGSVTFSAFAGSKRVLFAWASW